MLRQQKKDKNAFGTRQLYNEHEPAQHLRILHVRMSHFWKKKSGAQCFAGNMTISRRLDEKKNINHLPKHHDHVRREHNVWMEASVRMRANLMVTQTFRKHSQQVVLLKAQEIGCCIEPLQRTKRALQHAHCATGSHATA